MLKFLTHKLRTHSLNEDNVTEKVEERDSGTESDDEAERADENCDVIMKWNDVTDIGSCNGGCSCPTPRRPEPDLHYDHHSSEEELEVINSVPSEAVAGSPPRATGKRKWHDNDPHSDDDDDTKVETPVRFRTSPPTSAVRPRRPSPSPAPAPRPRRRAPPPRRHRPALDFDKMQQLKVRGAGPRSWRAVGGAGGELSVYCW